MYRVLIFILFCLILPTDLVRAIPPPDLIISSSQAVFATLGLLLSSVFIWWSQLRTWLSLRKKNKLIFASILTITTVLVVVALYQLPKIREAYWRTIIDEEVRILWVEYEPTYSAQSEVSARKELLSETSKVTWDNFMKVVDGGDYLVVDIREGYGYETGRIPGSINVRFGDLVNGEWQKLLPYKNKPIYIVCYIGSTGSLTIKFLESKGFTELYRPDGGLMKAIYVENGFPFDGTIEAPGVNGNTNLITKYEFHKVVHAGSKIIDMRAPSHYEDNLGFDISHRHFREFMTTEAIKSFVNSLDKQHSYVMLCDSELSCYQGEMLYEDLKRLNIAVSGVYRNY